MSASRHSLRWIVITGSIVGALVIIPIFVLFSMFVFRDNPGAKSFDDALQAFRAGDPSKIESIGAVVVRPPAGVYQSDASGKASISFPPTSQNYGTFAPVTVTHQGDNCWTTSVDFNAAFQQRWGYCIEDGVLTEHSNQTTTSWDLGAASITNISTFICSPPSEIIKTGERREEVSTSTCIGTSDSISGTTTSAVTFESLGAESLDINSVATPTFHYRETDLLTGPQKGTTIVDYWYSLQDMLLLRMERRINLRTDSPVGEITYKEDGEWQLSSLTPVR
jgi:hypothetical protein